MEYDKAGIYSAYMTSNNRKILQAKCDSANLSSDITSDHFKWLCGRYMPDFLDNCSGVLSWYLNDLSRSLSVIGDGMVRKTTYDFLLTHT